MGQIKRIWLSSRYLGQIKRIWLSSRYLGQRQPNRPNFRLTPAWLFDTLAQMQRPFLQEVPTPEA
jgi:hypothetical protein